ncbi:MAG: helix-hairpin-helix domain-containing protein [Cellulosilyticaceae bacterium]
MVELVKKYKLVLMIIIVVGLNMIVSYLKNNVTENDNVPISDVVSTQNIIMENIVLESDQTDTVEVNEIMSTDQIVPVFVCGAVKNPDVYYLNQNAIIQEAISLAGGFDEEADINLVNLAKPIEPNGKIYVPKIGEETDQMLNSYDNTDNSSKETGLVNINIAAQAELETLPGIGQAKALQIINYRESSGKFEKIEDLMNVTGIGTKTFETLKPFIKVN